MTSSNRLLLASLVLFAGACGDDGNSNPDAPPGDVGPMACATATTMIASYPGMLDDTIVGSGKDLTVPEMGCANESDWFEPKGEDKVIALTGLTVGSRYGITLSSDDDVSMYVTPSCPPASGAVTGCVLFTDTGLEGDGETGLFTATATEMYLIIDNAELPAPSTGEFNVKVVEAQCSADTEMADCSAATPFCLDFACKQCVSAFDCTAGTPVCGTDAACIAGPAACTGDDARDSGAGDDGPSVAFMLATPTVGTPTTITGNVCNNPDRISESDWYKVMLTADVSVKLDFTGAANDLDFFVLDGTGATVASGTANGAVNERALTDGVVPGIYYILVTQYAPTNNTPAVPYTLTVGIPECDPDLFLQCAANGTNTVCDAGTCSPGPAQCLLDTAGEPADDGPGGARTLASGTALTGAICTTPDTELDFYKFTVTAGQGYTINVAWTGTADLDVYVTDAMGVPYGQTFYKNPEVITLTNLAAGTYYVRVENFLPMGGTPSTTSQDYTITGTQTAIVQCTDAASCANEHSTQFFRGVCTPATDVCSFIPAAMGANNTICDSGNDCMSGRCSLVPFEADAERSVCIPSSCTSDAVCMAIGADLRCTTGFTTNFCQPTCTNNLDCGARPSSSMLDLNQPWDYLTCTTATGVCSTP